MKKANTVYTVFNIVMVVFLTFAIFFTLQVEQSLAHSIPQFVGIDTNVDPYGLVIVNYEGQTYHLTEWDRLAGMTIIYIDSRANDILIEQNNNLKKIQFFTKGPCVNTANCSRVTAF